jgi:hypothetical protein
MTSEFEKFVNDGIQRCGEAHAAIRLFTGQAQKRMAEVVDSLVEEGVLQRTAGAKVEPHRGTTPSDWINVELEVSISEVKGTAEVGLWWNCEEAKGTPPVIVYATIWEKKSANEFPYRPSTPRFGSFDWNGRTHVYVVPEQGADLATLVRDVVGELARALAKGTELRGRSSGR